MPAMDENVIKRIMPHSLEAEQSVIGSMFIDAEAIAAATEQISGEDFYNRQYGVVFDTIVELNNEGKPIDFVTLQDRLRSKEDVPPEVSGLDFLTNLIAAVPTSANIKYYAGIVAEKATLRRLIRTNEEIAIPVIAARRVWIRFWRVPRARSMKWYRRKTSRNSYRFVP